MKKINNIMIRDELDVLVIVGPTASGKTSLSIELAKELDGEIISGDAYQVYKNMNIGTAKVTVEEMSGIKHHLIDIIDYKDKYDVSIFQKMAREKIDEIKSRNKLPIIVGGTGLYIKAVLYEYEFIHDEKLSSLQNSLFNESLTYLQEYCNAHGITLNNSEMNNHKHLVNIVAKDKLGISHNNKADVQFYKNHQIICLATKREELYDRINMRVEEMFENGLVEEVLQFEADHLSQLAIGYKEIHQHQEDLIVAKELIKQNSRNFAKRQVSWFKNKMDVDMYNKVEDQWELHQN
jgi:tRNA dimethylallyltransferase